MDDFEFNQMSGSSHKNTSSQKFQAPVDPGLLQVRFDRLLKVTEALWSLVLEISDLTEEDLMQKVQELQIEEKRLQESGDVKVSVMHCRNCGKVISRKLCKCQYCGEEYLGKTAFETI